MLSANFWEVKSENVISGVLSRRSSSSKTLCCFSILANESKRVSVWGFSLGETLDIRVSSISSGGPEESSSSLGSGHNGTSGGLIGIVLVDIWSQSEGCEHVKLKSDISRDGTWEGGAGISTKSGAF